MTIRDDYNLSVDFVPLSLGRVYVDPSGLTHVGRSFGEEKANSRSLAKQRKLIAFNKLFSERKYVLTTPLNLEKIKEDIKYYEGIIQESKDEDSFHRKLGSSARGHFSPKVPLKTAKIWKREYSNIYDILKEGWETHLIDNYSVFADEATQFLRKSEKLSPSNVELLAATIVEGSGNGIFTANKRMPIGKQRKNLD